MIKTYEEALEKIFTNDPIEEYSIENVYKAMDFLNNPLKNIKVIHIAWTNWKWSVSKMTFSALKESWKRVWVLTQPHLISQKERFLTESWYITEEEYIILSNKVLNIPIKLSQFEKQVLIWFLFFNLRNSEYAVIEVWLWWRLDATNVVNPFITAITSISFDHQNILWKTLEEISREKAWIIKKWIPIVYNHKNDVIESIAIKNNSPIIFTNKKVKTNLLWDFQEKNAAIAYEICKYLWLKKETILYWLQNVNHNWRLQFIKNNLLIDWAHNEDSLRKLKDYINSNLKQKYENIFYCFSIKKGKSIDLILDNIWRENNFIILDIKSEKLEDLSRCFSEYNHKTKTELLFEVKNNVNNLYIVFWSLYMIWTFIDLK